MKWGVVLSLLLVWVEIGRAEDNEDTRKTLRNLAGVSVIMPEMNPDAENDGLTQAQLQTDVELRLRKTGIRVLTNEEAQKVPGNPHLYVNVSTYKTASGSYVVSTHIGLLQMANIVATGELCLVETWNAPINFGVVGAENLRDAREMVDDLVDQFMNAWLSVNPMKR